MPPASASGWVWLGHDPLCSTACPKSPREPGATRWVHTDQAAGRLAADRDRGRVAAERGDVALDPAQRGLLVQQPVVAGLALLRGERRVREEAEPPSR